MEAADLVVINTCAIRELAEAKVIGRQGHLAAPQGRQPVAAGRPHRLRRPRARPRRPGASLPGGRPLPAARRGARARRSPRARLGAGDRWGGRCGRHDGRRTDRGRGRRPPRRDAGGGRRRRLRPARLGGVRLAADHLRLRQDLHLLHRAVQPRPGAKPAVRRDRRRGPDDRRGRLSARSPSSARTSTPTATTCRPSRASGTSPPSAGPAAASTSGRGPDLAELIRAIDGIRTADGAPAIPRLRFITSHPWDLSDRLIEAMAECPSLCESLHLPVQSGDDEVLRRMGRQYTTEHYLERLETDPGGDPGDHDLAPTSSSASAARPRPSSSGPSGSSRRSATTRSSRPRTRSGPARPPRASPTTSPRPRSDDA